MNHSFVLMGRCPIPRRYNGQSPLPLPRLLLREARGRACLAVIARQFCHCGLDPQSSWVDYRTMPITVSISKA